MNQPVLWREAWAGADLMPRSWLAYTGATIAPFGGMFDQGLRLRASAGYGGYRFRDLPSSGGASPKSFEAHTHFSEALVGYLHRSGPLTLKGFLGLSTVTHSPAPDEPMSALKGTETGVKGVAEFWFDLAPGWLSLDLSYATAHGTAAARVRAGYRLRPTLSLGLETGANVDDLDQSARLGAFARYEWYGGEISLSGGVASGAPFGTSPLDLEHRDPYVTVNWLVQF